MQNDESTTTSLHEKADFNSYQKTLMKIRELLNSGVYSISLEINNGPLRHVIKRKVESVIGLQRATENGNQIVFNVNEEEKENLLGEINKRDAGIFPDSVTQLTNEEDIKAA